MRLVIHPALDNDTLQPVVGVSSSLTVVNALSPQDALAAFADADAFYGTITPDLLSCARRLKWIQAPIAGLEKYLFPALRDSDVVLTNMRGIFSDHIADHAFTYLLMFARGFHHYFRKQLRSNWEPNEPVLHLGDSTLGIIGFGGIGQAVARRGLAHELRVIAVDPVPKTMDGVEVRTMYKLNDLLAQSDFVISCAPHTPATEKLIAAPQLARMKRTAYLINISRGIIVDLQSLTDALTNGTIAGAGLDVYEIEPLPSDHPLWKLENVILTPHTAGHDPHYEERKIKVLTENLRRFVNGQPLINVVDKAQWFAVSGELPDTK